MFKNSEKLLRFGRRPRPGTVRQQWAYGYPDGHRPFQGGQNHFQENLLKSANHTAQSAEQNAYRSLGRDNGVAVLAKKSSDSKVSSMGTGGASTGVASNIEGSLPWNVKLPQADFAHQRGMENLSVDEKVAKEMEVLRAVDGNPLPNGQRSFNSRVWYEEEKMMMQSKAHSSSDRDGAPPPQIEGAEQSATNTERSIMDAEEFEQQHGFSLLKSESQLAEVNSNFEQMDLWAEMGKYHRDMYFLYCISRRRNVYAVMYDFDGKRVHPVFTAGNRGFKDGQAGLGGSGGADVAHQVTSQYLNEVIPILRGRDDEAGLKRDKYELVVRVMGFYNGRGGSLRAVQDRSDVFSVRYLEDITPFPLNGPRMPKRVFRNSPKKII